MYDLHIDELIYAYYSRAFAAGYLPVSFETFFLHPPGYYALFFKDLEGIKYEVVCTKHDAV